MLEVNKKLKNILIVGGIIILLLLLWGDLFYLKKTIETSEKVIPKTLYIINKTKYDVELKTKLILNDIFNYDSIYVKYDYMIQPIYIDGREVAAFVHKNPMFNNKYLIYMSKKIKPYHEDIVISHELIHIHQYESGDLKLLNICTGTYLYNCDTLMINDIPYNERPFETDAYQMEDSIYNELQILLEEHKK